MFVCMYFGEAENLGTSKVINKTNFHPVFLHFSNQYCVGNKPFSQFTNINTISIVSTGATYSLFDHNRPGKAL